MFFRVKISVSNSYVIKFVQKINRSRRHFYQIHGQT